MRIDERSDRLGVNASKIMLSARHHVQSRIWEVVHKGLAHSYGTDGIAIAPQQ